MVNCIVFLHTQRDTLLYFLISRTHTHNQIHTYIHTHSLSCKIIFWSSVVLISSTRLFIINLNRKRMSCVFSRVSRGIKLSLKYVKEFSAIKYWYASLVQHRYSYPRELHKTRNSQYVIWIIFTFKFERFKLQFPPSKPNSFSHLHTHHVYVYL